MSHYRVLVIGPRRALIEALRARGIPYAVWREKAAFPVADALHVVTAPLWQGRAKIRQLAGTAFAALGCSHVIAGSEAAVYPAAVARRVLGARHSPATTALRCRDKLAMKDYLAEHGIPMTDFLAEAAARSPAEVFARLGTPVVCKRRKASGGRGMTLIHRAEDLVLRRYGRHILERHVDAPEASIESFVNGGVIRFVNTTRYLEKGHVNFVPSGFEPGLLAALHAFNRRVIEALRISWGITHLEVYLARDGLLFGEIALRPPGGYLMDAMRHAWGFDPWAALLAVELDEDFDFPHRPLAWTGVDIFHPGAGRVAAIHGAEPVRRHPATREFRLKVGPGECIAAREGAGQDVGHLLFAAASPAARDALLGEFRRTFAIELQRRPP